MKERKKIQQEKANSFTVEWVCL